MRNPVFIAFVLFVAILISGCGEQTAEIPGDPESGEKVALVTTIFPLADIVSELGGELVEVSYLLTPGASPHTFEPTVEQARLVEEADIFIYIGAGLDDWAVRLADGTAAGPAMLDLSGEVLLLEAAGNLRLDDVEHDHHDCDHDHDHDHHEDCDDGCDHNGHDHSGCDHGPDDPHFWLDPITVRDIICPAIHSELVKRATGQEAYLDQRLDSYRSELTELHDEIEAVTGSFTSRGFISFHSAWQYFGRRYNLQEVAVIAHFPGQEPSAGWVAELVKMIREEEIAAIFAEPQFPAALAERIAEESGSQVLVIDPLGGEGVEGRESYLDLMRFNLDAFREAME